MEYSIDYAKESNYKLRIIVTSESVLKEISNRNGVEFDLRDKSLCGDVEVVEVYIDLLKIRRKFDLIVCLQPDHPDREH